MARPNKIGLDYFPLNTDADLDDKVVLIRSKHSAAAYAVLLTIWSKIYADKGYFYSFEEKERILLANRTGVSIEKLSDYIESFLEFDLFNRELFHVEKILTSPGVQRVFIEATKRRKEIKIKADYLLADPEFLADYKHVKIVNETLNPINVTETLINETLTPINAALSTQRKEKKRRVKKTETETETETTIRPSPDFSFFWDEYDNKFSGKEDALSLWKTLSEEDRDEAILFIKTHRRRYPNRKYYPTAKTYLKSRDWTNAEEIKTELNQKENELYSFKGSAEADFSKVVRLSSIAAES